MSDASTRRMIEMYMEEASAPMFLSGFFRSPPQNFHTSEKVEIDIERDDDELAIAIHDLSEGGRINEASTYTNKAFTPPIYKEVGVVNAYNLMDRRAGEDPFVDPNFNANATRDAFRVFRKLERKIRRAIELQASQVFQEGKLTLKDENGTAVYELDFQAKTDHFPTVSNDWGAGSDTPIDDIDALSTTVRRDGKRVPDVLVFGNSAFLNFIKNTDVQAQFDLRRADRGFLTPPQRRGASGATFHGMFSVGHYTYEVWTYDGFYRDPVSGDFVPYVDPDKVIMLASSGRYDLSFGAIPQFVSQDPRVLPFLPRQFGDSERGLGFTTNAWLTPDNERLFVQAGTRPLAIPTAIDTFGCITTQAA